MAGRTVQPRRPQEQKNTLASPGKDVSYSSYQVDAHDSYRKISVRDIQRVTKPSPCSDSLPLCLDVDDAEIQSVCMLAKDGL